MPIKSVIFTDDLDGISNNTETGNFLIIRQNVLVSSVTGAAISFEMGSSSVLVSGMVAAVASHAIVMGNGLGGSGGNAVSVSQGGVIAAGSSAVYLDGTGFSEVVNDGTITSVGAWAVRLDGGSNKVVNNGTLSASNETVLFVGDGLQANHLTNTGVILADNRNATAVYNFEGSIEVVNRGTIIGDLRFSSTGDDLVDNEGGTIAGRIRFSGGNDELIGGSGRETAKGGSGDDLLDFAGGNDVYLAGLDFGGPPNDGNDDLDGGDGIDTYDARELFSSVTVRLHEMRATGSEIGIDLVMNFENAFGGWGNDTLIGDAGRNVLRGRNGDDVLNGLEGNDRLHGGAGVDTLVGNAGRDVMTGGADADIFDFNNVADSAVSDSARDIITDFEIGVDDIDLATIDANTVLANNQAFTFIGNAAFSNVAGQLRFVNQGASQYTVVEGDVNGDGKADFSIGLFGIIVLAATDFVL